MEKFAVAKKIGKFNPDIKEVFDDEENARKFAEALRSKGDGYEYGVYQLREDI